MEQFRVSCLGCEVLPLPSFPVDEGGGGGQRLFKYICSQLLPLKTDSVSLDVVFSTGMPRRFLSRNTGSGRSITQIFLLSAPSCVTRNVPASLSLRFSIYKNR